MNVIIFILLVQLLLQNPIWLFIPRIFVKFLAEPDRISDEPTALSTYADLGPGSAYKWSRARKPDAWCRRASSKMEELSVLILAVVRTRDAKYVGARCMRCPSNPSQTAKIEEASFETHIQTDRPGADKGQGQEGLSFFIDRDEPQWISAGECEGREGVEKARFVEEPAYDFEGEVHTIAEDNHLYIDLVRAMYGKPFIPWGLLCRQLPCDVVSLTVTSTLRQRNASVTVICKERKSNDNAHTNARTGGSHPYDGE
ncbi:hypothetical protein B0H14DRAFT_3872793, partial [Mycena olivaceomarginata]